MGKFMNFTFQSCWICGEIAPLKIWRFQDRSKCVQEKPEDACRQPASLLNGKHRNRKLAIDPVPVIPSLSYSLFSPWMASRCTVSLSGWLVLRCTGVITQPPNMARRCSCGQSPICWCFWMQYSCVAFLQPRGAIRKIQTDFLAALSARTKDGYREPGERCDSVCSFFKRLLRTTTEVLNLQEI